MTQTNYEQYTNYDALLERSKFWLVDERVRLSQWAKQGLTGIFSSKGIRYITKENEKRFEQGKSPINKAKLKE